MKTLPQRLALSLLAALSLSAAPALRAEPYKPLVLEDVVEGPAPTIYLGGLSAAVESLSPHASRMPPRFDNKAERDLAAKDARSLSDALDKPTRAANAPTELLQLAGHWNTLAWRMGYEAAGARAFEQLRRALRGEPDNARLQYLLGSFYTEFEGGSSHALPYLERAHDAGVIEASFTLGMLYIQLRDAKTARHYLEHFAVKTGTKDPNFLKLLNQLRYGDGGWTLTHPRQDLPASALVKLD
ncbi:hypothetical protein [Viridibacterium curvum]|uniref:Tetratricopeptide repeat protein n=1 Tax=Viridibacterium curvum TaxID=1101404 RepID=A0ABP9QFB5_9RHOO